LNADERAEVERLLAANPAAQQLLDELRALGATLRSLPQEELGEDLGPTVLRVAERRMLTGQESDFAVETPMPLGKAILGRIFNRRGLAWAGLAVAIAVMFSINEWWQQSHSVTTETTLIAMARRQEDAPQSVKAKAAEPTPEQDRATTKPAESSLESDLRGTLKTGIAGMPNGSSGPALKALSESAKESPSTEIKLAETVPAPAAPAEVKLNEAALPARAPAATDAFGDAEDEVATAKVHLDASGGEQVAKHRIAAEDIVVVRCDISRKAADRRMVEKLLDANGISWHEPIERERVADNSDAQGREQTKHARLDHDEEVDLIWVVATPGQIEAALAGLAAQPKEFLSCTVSKPSNELPKDIVQQVIAAGGTFRQSVPGGGLLQFEQQPKVAGPAMESGTVGQLAMKKSEAKPFAAKFQPPLAATKTVETSKPAADEGKEHASFESSAMQRVLFVLRVVGGAPSTGRLPTETPSSRGSK
jgi:hypothetical protein